MIATSSATSCPVALQFCSESDQESVVYRKRYAQTLVLLVSQLLATSGARFHLQHLLTLMNQVETNVDATSS
jgi:hypothetical protein